MCAFLTTLSALDTQSYPETHSALAGARCSACARADVELGRARAAPRVGRAVGEGREEEHRAAGARGHGHVQALKARRAAGRHVVQVHQQRRGALEAVAGRQLRREAVLRGRERWDSFPMVLSNGRQLAVTVYWINLPMPLLSPPSPPCQRV